MHPILLEQEERNGSVSLRNVQMHRGVRVKRGFGRVHLRLGTTFYVGHPKSVAERVGLRSLSLCHSPSGLYKLFEAYLICHLGAILPKYFDSDAVCLHDRAGGADRGSYNVASAGDSELQEETWI